MRTNATDAKRASHRGISFPEKRTLVHHENVKQDLNCRNLDDFRRRFNLTQQELERSDRHTLESEQ
jgi:hypothetical protein